MVSILLLLCPVASADLGIVDALSDIVKGGIDMFLLGCADNLYEQSYAPPGSEVLNGTSTEIFIYALTTSTIDPWSKPGIIDVLKKTWMYVMIYASIYATNGLLYLLLVFVSPAAADTLDGVLNRSVALRAIRVKQYFENLLTALAVLGFTSTVMQFLFTISLFLTALCILSCMSVRPLTLGTDNVILYTSIAIYYAVLSWFFSARGLLLYVFVAASFVIGALLISNKTRDMGLSIGYYFVGILFMQPIIVFLTTLGFIAAEALCSDSGIVAGSIGEIVIYMIVLFIIVIVTLRLMFGIRRYRKRAVQAVRLVI